MLKLKLQYFGHLMRRVDSLEKTLMLGGIVGRRRKGRPRMRWLDGIAAIESLVNNPLVRRGVEYTAKLLLERCERAVCLLGQLFNRDVVEDIVVYGIDK